MTRMIEAIIKKINTEKANLGITLFNQASEADISTFEKIKRVNLPDDLKTFYRFSNGFESEEDLFRIIPLHEILENSPSNYTVGIKDFHIAEY